MVAEPRINSAVEKIVRHWLSAVQAREVHYSFVQSAQQPFFALRHVSGLDSGATIQFDIWGVDKESTLDQLNNLLNLVENVASYQTPYGTIAGATPINYFWAPDELQSRYICDALFVTYTTV